MLPSKVQEVIDALTPIFINMKELKGLPTRVEAKRNNLLAQGRVIIKKLRQYVNVEYSKDEYKDVYGRMCKRLLAQYLQAKQTLTIANAIAILSDAKQLQKEWKEKVGEKSPDVAFQGMISELRTFITSGI